METFFQVLLYFSWQLNKLHPSKSLTCQTLWWPISLVQVDMGQMFRQGSGARACAPALMTASSVSTNLFTLSETHLFHKFSNTITLYFAGALGFFCPAGLSCYTAHKYGENFCLGCVPGGMTAMRTHMRLTYGIQVGVSDLSLTLVKDGARVFVFSEVVSLTQIFSHFLIQGWTFRLLNLCCNSLTNREQYATMPLWSFAADFAKCAGWLGKSASEMEKCLFNEIYI